ncbi:MAG: AMP-binding protein [Vulcanisaeta sp.]|uniref:AMP-binding protein n=1 Tax=Vulcanisaeta sp. TaxID=2020871 RepID=UPI003D110F2B
MVEVALDVDFRDYQLNIRKVIEYGLQIAPEQRVLFAPPNLPIKEYTYKDLYSRVNALGLFLDELNVKRAEKPREFGGKIAVMDWNTVRYLELMFGVPMYGATLFTVNIRLAPEEILYTMGIVKPEALFIHMDFLPLLKSILTNINSIKHVIIMDDASTVGTETSKVKVEVPSGVRVYEYEDVVGRGKSYYDWPDVEEHIIAEIFFTSGTTGRPKAVYHMHRQVVIGTMQLLIAEEQPPVLINNRDYQLITTPMFHILAWLHPYESFLIGAPMVLPSRYDWRYITRLLVDKLIPDARKLNGRVIAKGVPSMLISIIESAKSMGISDLHGFSYGYGGQALPVAVYEEAKKMGIEILTGYGPSETLTAITRSFMVPRYYLREGYDFEKFRDHQVIGNSLGTPVPLTLVKVIDENGRELPWDGKTIGRLVFYSPTITREYFGDTEKTERAWRFRYFDVDDMVVIDEHGCVFFVDREKDAVKSGGEWIPSSRLEMFISTHPAVSEVAVIGIPHPKWVERPIAIVALKPEYIGKVTEDEIKSYLQREFVDKGLMPKWWIPDKFVFVKTEELPRTGTAKIDKKVLRERYKNMFM